MRPFAFILLIAVASSPGFSQYYLRGEVKDEKGNKLQNVNIVVYSSDRIYHTGIYGDFGFFSSRLVDTLNFSLDGYISEKTTINATDYIKVTLKMKPEGEGLKRNQLSSYIRNLRESSNEIRQDGESYSTLSENPFVITEKSPVASFSPNTNKASYSNIRRFLNMKMEIPPDAVRIEEMLNYFNLHYSEPFKGEQVNCSSYLTDCPWNRQNRLLYLNVCASRTNMDNIPPSNLVFLIDISGSMDLPNKLPLLKSGLRLLINNLRDIDTVSIISYGAEVITWMEGVPGSEKKKIDDVISGMQAAGSTPGEAGIRMAYKVAQRRWIKDGNNRIILATDGDFNVGFSTEKDLEELIEQQKQTGIYLSCFGVGMGNYKDSKLSLLAQKGHGNFSYIDNEREAEKVFVTELTQTLYTVADSVTISAEFNADLVKAYRLIGFENKRSVLTDTTSKIEAGELGSGQSLMAIFELNLHSEENGKENLGSIKITYHLPHESLVHTVLSPCRNNLIQFKDADSSYRQAACITMFGMKLRESNYAGRISWKFIEDFGNSCFSKGNILGNEFMGMLKNAEEIYRRKKKKLF